MNFFDIIQYNVKISYFLTGSSMNSATPCPVDKTNAVAEPYNAYPPATSWVPGCKASLIVGLSWDVFLTNETLKHHYVHNLESS